MDGSLSTEVNDKIAESARSVCTYVQADIALHSLQNNSMVTNDLTKVKTGNRSIFVRLFTAPSDWTRLISVHQSRTYQGPYSPSIIKNILCLFLQVV